jgi:cadmium resistance protein CadD (predicted permease)
MPGLVPTIATASALYVGTNLDDMTMLLVLNASSRVTGTPKSWQIWAGQSVGIAVLVALSLLAALGLTVLPDRFVWTLGLVPLGIGLHHLGAAWRAHRAGEAPPRPASTHVHGIAALTIANGGDNIAAYTALFRPSSGPTVAVILTVFAVGVVAWCAIGSLLASHPRVAEATRRWGHWIGPVLFIAIGALTICRG